MPRCAGLKRFSGGFCARRPISAPVFSVVARAGSPATIRREPRQARKGAAVVADSGAGVQLVRAAALYTQSVLSRLALALFP